jgi:hypothetical protein
MLFNLLLIFTLFMGAIYWWVGQKAKTQAVEAAKRRCNDLDLQFLDSTVELYRVRIAMHRGQPMLKREFRFEFSSHGDARFNGYVCMLSSSVTAINLDAHTF